MFLTFDTETTGLPKNFNAPVSESENWPRLVQLAWQLNDNNGRLISVNSHIIKPDGYSIPYNSEKIHGISTEIALKEGKKLGNILKEFEKDLLRSKYIKMDSSYVKSEEKGNKLGEWILFFNILLIFIWLLYELYASFNTEPSYRWEKSFNIVGLSSGIIFVFILLVALARSLIKKTFS